MPTYEYKCKACGYTFEKFQNISAKPLRKCPNCNRNKLKRLIGSGSGIIFRGEGWPGQEIVRGQEDETKKATN